MALEPLWSAVPPVLLTSDGSTNGVVIVTDTAGFYTKQRAILQAPLLPPLLIQIKRVVDQHTLWVGLVGPTMTHNIDVSAYTVAAGSFIFAEEQNKTTMPMEARMLATYETDPVDAWRIKAVDAYGNGYTDTNPLPVAFDGTVTIGEVTIVGPAPDKNELNVNADGSINVDLNGLSTFQTSQYSIGTSAVQITPTPMPNRSSIGFKAIATSTNAIWIGNSAGVTVSTGYPLFNHDTLEMDLEGGETIYAISSAVGQTLCVVELGD